MSGKAEKGDNPTIIEPFNIKSLPDKEKYDEGVVLSMAKLYDYILDNSNPDQRPPPGKLNDDRFDDMGKRPDDDSRVPGKLKNPFDNQEKAPDRKRPVPGKLNNPFGDEDKDSPEKKKYSGKKPDDDEEKYKNLLYGALAPEDPVNAEIINNIETMADPVYTPDNYIFVKEFNNQMDTLMNKLGKYDEEPSPEDEKIQVRENYLSHLNTMFNKAVPFLDDLHKEINKSATGQYPEIRKEKEDNLDTILDGAELYYKADEDNDIKADAAKNMLDACLNLIDDLSKDGIVDQDRKEKMDQLQTRLNKLWKLVNEAVKNDENNQLLDPNNINRTRELMNKLDTLINTKGYNDKKLREIPLNLSKRLVNGEDKLGQDLLDFTLKDLEKHGKEDPEIEVMDYQSLTSLSKFPNLMKQIIRNDAIWHDLIKDYQNPDLTYENRLMLATLFNNAAQSNYNIENMINNDPQLMKNILDVMINKPVTKLEDGGREIAEKEVDSIYNILKDTNNYKLLSKNDLITDEQIAKLDTLYKALDPKLGEHLRPLLLKIREADKAKKEKDEVIEDEGKLLGIANKVDGCFDNHKKLLLRYAAAKRNLPGKLKNPFDNQEKPPEKERYVPGKLKNPFDNQEKPPEKERYIPGKLNNPFEDNPRQSGVLKDASSLRKMSFVSGALMLHRDDNAKIKSALSCAENPEMPENINEILALLRKNYNDMKTTEDPELNVKRADNVHKCLNLLKKLSLAPDNHKPILEGGFLNFMEKLEPEHKLLNEKGEPDLRNKNLGFEVSSKNVLQACSNSENAIPLIQESPVFEETIQEVNKLYENPELIAANSDIQKLFTYDNVIFSNLCKDKEAFDTIFNKMGIDELITLGLKTGNIALLKAITNMLKNYVKNAPNKEQIPPEILEPTFQIMNKCAGLNDRDAPLMCNVLDLATILNEDKNLKQKVDNLHLIKNMSDDIVKFNGNHQYLNSCLNCLSSLTKDNPINGQEAIDSGLMKNLNVEVSNIIEEGPEKYEENKDNDEDENGYLKTCFNLSKLYNSLVRNDMTNVDKFNNMGITEKTVKMLDHFNNNVEPKTEDEIAEEQNKKRLLEATNVDNVVIPPEPNVDEMKPPQLVRGIMQNCAETLEQITVPPISNEFLATNTQFSDTINKTLDNENNDSDYMLSALRALSNHVYKDNGKNYDKLDLPETYRICHELQSKFYSNPEILQNINAVSGAMVRNLKNDSKGKEFTKKFYDLIPETIKVQDYNPDLVLMSLKLMNDGLVNKPYLVDQVYEETVPITLNLLKLYKDVPEIQEQGYKILSAFARNNVFSSAMINNGLLDCMRDTMENPIFADSQNPNVRELKSGIFQLLNNLSGEKENCPKIADELMGNLNSELIEKGYNDEGKIIVPLLNNLVLNKECVPPFVQYKGIDALIKLLNDNDTNISLISNAFQIFKNVANASDEYKKMLHDKKVPDLINRIIKKVGPYDKKIEFEGRQLLFNCNLYKIELEDPNSIGVDEIKIVEPIPPPVRNFLTSGKQVKIVNNNGDIKQMQLIFSADLMRVSAKKIKSNLPPKPKYIIDTPTIKKVLKGHGTDAFKKTKGLFRKIPPPEVCFSIIGPTSVEGVKSLNVQCDSEKDVDRWISYLKIVIDYFKKTHAIKGAVIIKK